MKRGMPSGAQTPDGIIFLLALIFSKAPPRYPPHHGAHWAYTLVSFIAYKADIVLDALAEALQRNVDINILLDISPKQGIADNYASISNMRAKLPAAKFYIWDKKHNPDGASVHAKCAVADRTTALITSANLTGKAMNSNMELGIYIKNGHIPFQLSSLLEALITEKTITLHNVGGVFIP